MGLSYENMEKLAGLKKKYLFPPEDTEIFRDLKTVAEGYTFLESWKETAVVLDHGKQAENRNCSKGVRRIRIGVKFASFMKSFRINTRYQTISVGLYSTTHHSLGLNAFMMDLCL